jgi:hypothetical protein
MKYYLQCVATRPIPLYLQHSKSETEPQHSDVALKIEMWLKTLPEDKRSGPVLSADAAKAIGRTVTACGLALRELGWRRRLGGAVGDPVRLRGRRVWVLSAGVG